MLQTIETALGELGGIIWGPYVLIPLLLLTGLYLTVRLGGLQFHKLGSALRLALFDRKDADARGGDVSQFQALTTALAATVGTGNIVGVATAISIGVAVITFLLIEHPFLQLRARLLASRQRLTAPTLEPAT